MLTPKFRHCPYCGIRLLDPIRPGDHRKCVYCDDRCLTCEERESKGWSKCHPRSDYLETSPTTKG